MKTVRRKEVAEKIKVALSFGDLSENSEYDEAKNDQAMVEARIADLEVMLQGAVVIDESELNNETVHIGSKIEVDLTSATGVQSRRDFKIVGSNEADPRNGKISDESAVGKALIGAKVGDTVEVETPAGIFQVSHRHHLPLRETVWKTGKGMDKMAEKNGRAPQMEEEQDMSEILRVRREKLRELQESGNDPYQITKYPVDNDSANIKANFDQLEGKPVSIAGRMMSKRGMGKVSFCDLQGPLWPHPALRPQGREWAEEDYNRFKNYDIGDILGVQGRGVSAPSGERCPVRVEKVTLLSKSLLPLPEKYHGLKDNGRPVPPALCGPDRQPGSEGCIRQALQDYQRHPGVLGQPRFPEVETPVLHNQAGGAAARPLHYSSQHTGHRHVPAHRVGAAPEAAYRGCFDRVYEIGRTFRNEGMDTRHNPEFTMLRPIRPLPTSTA